MESWEERFRLLEKHMHRLEEENKELTKEVAILKQKNIGFQEELSSLSLDRNCQINTNREATVQILEQCLGVNGQMEPGKRKLADIPDASVDKRQMTSLEQQLDQLGQRLKEVESIEDLKRKCVFNVCLTISSPLTPGTFARLDHWLDNSYLNLGEIFDKKNCNFQFPVHGIYGLELFHQINGAEVEIYLSLPSGHHYFLAKSKRETKFGSKIILLQCDPGLYSIVVKNVSNVPMDRSMVCFAGWLIQPL